MYLKKETVCLLVISKLLKTLRALDRSIQLVEGLGSYKATPNLDVKSRGPNYTTIILRPFNRVHRRQGS